MKVTPQLILQCLPDAPEGFHHSVEQVSPLVHRVWLHHHREYVYAEGDEVKTVWGFVKGGKVYPAKNYKTLKPKSQCSLLDAWHLSGYTCYVHNTPSLQYIK